jgi:hypothetical protein
MLHLLIIRLHISIGISLFAFLRLTSLRITWAEDCLME